MVYTEHVTVARILARLNLSLCYHINIDGQRVAVQIEGRREQGRLEDLGDLAWLLGGRLQEFPPKA